MQSQFLIVLLAAAAASGRPVPSPHEHGVEVPRELQYSDIAALAGAPEWRHGAKGDHDRHHDHPYGHDDDERKPYSRPFPGEWHPQPHDHHPHDFFGVDHMHRGPHDHHHGGPQGDVFDNIFDFFSHHARAVPEVPSRVVNGIIDFLSHETRSLPEEHVHDKRDTHENQVIRNIIDFFAKATR